MGRSRRRDGTAEPNGIRRFLSPGGPRARGARLLLIAALLFGGIGIGRFGASAEESPIPGRFAFVRDGDVWQWSNGDASRIVGAGNASDARWSPDGTQVLYVRSGNSYSDLVIYNILTGGTQQVTYNQPPYEEGTPEYIAASAWAVDPDWSASGLIGFMGDAGNGDGGSLQLWLVDDPSAGPYLAPAAQSEDNIEGLSLSSGGSLAAYTVQERQGDGTSANRVVVRDLTDGVAYPLAESKNAFDPAISPDATSIAVSIRNDGASDIFLVDRASGKITRVTRNLQATNPTWSPDGRWIAFVRMVDYQFEVWAAEVVNGDPGRPFKVFKAKGLDARSGVSWTFGALQPQA